MFCPFARPCITMTTMVSARQTKPHCGSDQPFAQRECDEDQREEVQPRDGVAGYHEVKAEGEGRSGCREHDHNRAVAAQPDRAAESTQEAAPFALRLGRPPAHQ